MMLKQGGYQLVSFGECICLVIGFTEYEHLCLGELLAIQIGRLHPWLESSLLSPVRKRMGIMANGSSSRRSNRHSAITSWCSTPYPPECGRGAGLLR